MTTRQQGYQVMTTASRKDYRHQAVNVRTEKLRIFSSEGIRTDIVILLFVAVFVLFFGLLSWDVTQLSSAGSDIRKASSRIETLKVQNEQYRLDVALAEQHPVLTTDPYDEAFLIRMTVPDANTGFAAVSTHP